MPKTKARLVLDTNIFISAIALKSSNLRKLVDFSLEYFEVCLSGEILQELENKLRTKFTYSESEQRQIKLITQSSTQFFDLPNVPFARDPKDAHILALCQVSEAKYLITGDKDLLELHTHQNTLILSPREFIEKLS